LKICPECSTQYEEHVELCLIDGSTLEPMAGEEPAPPPSSHETSSRAGLGLLALLFGGALAVAISALAIALVFLPGSSPPPAPEPQPVAAPPVAPPPAAPPVVAAAKVGVTSEPAGAQVSENGRILCQTPCTIEHPPDAPLPRTLKLELDGHRDATVQLTDPDVPLFQRLEAIPSTRPRPRPRPTPPPRPVAPRAGPGAPSIGTSR
jgi:hypothetical protein